MINKRSESVPAAMQAVHDEIAILMDSFCRKHLNEEYATLARELAAALARKRPSPLDRGKPGIWACAIVYALGTVNFLFDKTQTPHLRADELCASFGVSQSSGANKARQIRDLFGMSYFDPQWCLPSKIGDNPMVWMLEVNGFVVDVRRMTREIQEKAFRSGLIPYIPADRNAPEHGDADK
jgi:hypothetical protein